IARALRDGVRWGSKSGWVDGYRHDVAFVGDPDGEDLRLLAVMTAGLAPQQADARIAERVRQLLPDLAVWTVRGRRGWAGQPARCTRRAPAYSPVGSYSVSDMISTLRAAFGACMIRSSPRCSATCRIEVPPGSVAKNTRSPRCRSSRSTGSRPQWCIWSPASRWIVMPWWWNREYVYPEQSKP